MPTIFSTGGSSGASLDFAIQDLALFGKYSWAMNDDETSIKLCADPHAINSNMVNHFLGDYAIGFGQHLGNMVAKCNRIDETIDWSNIPTTSELVTVPNALSAVIINPSASSLLETFISEYFSTNSIANIPWDVLAAGAGNGFLSKNLPNGAEKNLTVNGETLTFQLLGHNHDVENSATFGLKDLMATTKRMSATSTNIGGWGATGMYQWLQETLFPALPSELKPGIKTIKKKTSAGNLSSSIIEVECKLFQFSEIEIYGGVPNSFDGEGRQYDYFKEKGITTSVYANAIKKLANGTGAASAYWQRSPSAGSATSFCLVNSDGSPGYISAGFVCGVCFGFTIG